MRIVFLTAGLLGAAEIAPQADRLTVHEWGTFTSVAGPDGAPQRWLPLSGPPDLPCFVHRSQVVRKGAVMDTVRMETPVIYFYSPKPSTASVRVDFRGFITEWYPHGKTEPSFSNPSRIEWDPIALSRGAQTLPVESASSHYYAARNTDAMNVESGGEHEKLLFYRGVGGFDIPLRAAFTADGISLRNKAADPLPLAMIFENHGGKIGYSAVQDLQGPATVRFTDLRQGDLSEVRNRLELSLIQTGLYPLEASAMLDTWRDSWFEEGMRVFYLMPRSGVDQVLPLTIRPRPVETVRAFVGRAELLSPWMREEIVTGLRRGDTAVLAKYGRFLDSYLQQIGKPDMTDGAIDWLEKRRETAERDDPPTGCGAETSAQR